MSKIKNIFMLALIALFAFSTCNNLDDTDINPIEPPKEDGNGSLEKPYTVGQAILKQGETDKWVSGYIVGSVNSVLNENVWAFEPPFVTESNILLAASPTETDKAKILPIQLVAGTDIRAFLNLPKNPTRLGQVIKIKGELIKYFGVPGLKNPTDLVAEGYDPTNPPSEGDKVEVCGDQTTVEAGFTYDFNNVTDGQDFAEKGWQNLMIAGGRRWQGKVHQENGYIQATAHGATADQLQETWVITPALNLDGATNKIATFETAQAYWKEDTKFELNAWAGSKAITKTKYPFYSGWQLSTLIKWHRQDPVSQKEINRNEAIYKIQGNRNPYIDCPVLVEYIWGDRMGKPFEGSK